MASPGRGLGPAEEFHQIFRDSFETELADSLVAAVRRRHHEIILKFRQPNLTVIGCLKCNLRSLHRNRRGLGSCCGAAPPQVRSDMNSSAALASRSTVFL